jgi:thiol-disulfide isomerase/thioredoxin
LTRARPSISMESLAAAIDTSASDIIGLYFSGQYCRYCKEFTPVLVEAYPQLKANRIEIIYVSSDKSPEQYAEYRATQPWQALAYEEGSLRADLRSQFDIKTIPALLFFDAEHLQLIARDGRVMIRDDWPGAIRTLVDSIAHQYDSDEDF